VDPEAEAGTAAEAQPVGEGVVARRTRAQVGVVREEAVAAAGEGGGSRSKATKATATKAIKPAELVDPAAEIVAAEEAAAAAGAAAEAERLASEGASLEEEESEEEEDAQLREGFASRKRVKVAVTKLKKKRSKKQENPLRAIKEAQE